MDTTLQDPLIGHMLDGRYRVEARIAVGGMATVYRAVDTRLDRVLALKVMHPALAVDAQFVARFIREAKSAARLAHTNVVGVFDQGTDGGYVYLAMEYVAGCTLRDVLVRRRALQPRAALDILEPVLAALGAAHRAQLVHRDMKPENVLIGDDGRVKVADFGLVRAVDAQTSTSTTAVMGTVSYLAPEQIEHGTADTTADIYACGVMLYEMLTGAKPHTGSTPAQVMYQHLHRDVPAPSALVPGLAPGLDALVARAAARDPRQRPADAVGMLQEVRRARAALSDAELDAVPPRAGDGSADDVDPAGSSAGAGGPDDSPTTVLSGAAVDRTSVLAAEPLAGAGGGPTAAPGRPRRSRRSVLALIGTVLLVLGVGTGVWYINSGQFTHTPGVLRMPEAQAVTAVTDAGLRAQVTREHSSTVPRGRVVETDPVPGARIRGNSTVTLTVSRGPDVVKVPRLTGVPLAEARKRLKQAGLEPATVKREFHDEVEQGAVVRTDPRAGVERRPGSAVSLVVSKGEELDLPDVVGVKEATAREELEGTGFEVRVASRQVHSERPAGTVARMSPKAGGTGARGDTVTLTLSKGPEMVAVPDVIGAEEDEAVRTMEAAGFEVKVRRVFFTGEVFNQSVDGGERAPKGSTITLWIR
ncbi:Stk1 family PASTA domain-containing Ser/Thr kinase [Streptomyces sp. 549]|uniref:Stk1 family PASTA domain-containing Ser/Thr kinase n=1 Tax=Streptomyces sp. 549 TaxID=3049076 RepID=UPI0024C3C1BF|nr:Stk1 family PASTA domain-containing Ser/Thr kinase [Streptomyces sp. 549]MDK1475569.1 Stk1 family PASTA domain-containing Ser/Thr kinase [Streptomyces sp. 549]